MLEISLDWKLESPECNDTQIAITGEQTMLRLSVLNGLWKCEALYKSTTTELSEVAVWSSDDRSDAIHGCVAEILYQQSIAPPMFTCHDFNFG